MCQFCVQDIVSCKIRIEKLSAVLLLLRNIRVRQFCVQDIVSCNIRIEKFSTVLLLRNIRMWQSSWREKKGVCLFERGRNLNFPLYTRTLKKLYRP